MVQYQDDAELRCISCTALGSLLASRTPDVVHREAAEVLPIVFKAMRADIQSVELQRNALIAILSIATGNAAAVAEINAAEHTEILQEVMSYHQQDQRVTQHL